MIKKKKKILTAVAELGSPGTDTQCLSASPCPCIDASHFHTDPTSL